MSERDFAEFIRILVRHRVRFLVVGAYALAHHGYARATNDVDVLIATDEQNRARVRAAAARPPSNSSVSRRATRRFAPRAECFGSVLMQPTST